MNTIEATNNPVTDEPADETTARRDHRGRIVALSITIAALTVVILAGIFGATVDGVRSVRGGASLAMPIAPPAPERPATPTARPAASVDRLVPVHGARMHVRCEGSGDATVLLIAGFESGSVTWTAVEPAMAQKTRVCAYDKFGTGTSEAPVSTQTFRTQADDLREALRALGEPGPFVVVGHSFGGAAAVTFATKFGARKRARA